MGNDLQKWTTTWTQDNTAVGYEVNPRVIETNVYDPSGNRRRITIDYAQFGLPHVVREFAKDGMNDAHELLHHRHTDFDNGSCRPRTPSLMLIPSLTA